MRELSAKLFALNLLVIPAVILLGFIKFNDTEPVNTKVVTSASFLSTSQNDVEIIFFGYVGNAFITPSSLHTMGEVVDELKKKLPHLSLGAYFIDVNAEAEMGLAHQYSQNFSENIIGVNVNHAILEEFKELFGIVVFDTNRAMDEIIFSDDFYIVQRQGLDWKVVQVLPNDVDKGQLKRTVESVQSTDKEPKIMAFN